jgi:hypothetical protein
LLEGLVESCVIIEPKVSAEPEYVNGGGHMKTNNIRRIIWLRDQENKGAIWSLYKVAAVIWVG